MTLPVFAMEIFSRPTTTAPYSEDKVNCQSYRKDRNLCYNSYVSFFYFIDIENIR